MHFFNKHKAGIYFLIGIIFLLIAGCSNQKQTGYPNGAVLENISWHLPLKDGLNILKLKNGVRRLPVIGDSVQVTKSYTCFREPLAAKYDEQLGKIGQERISSTVIYYFFIAGVFQFLDLYLYQSHISHYWLFNALTPIEIGFFFYIPLYITNKSEHDNLISAMLTILIVLSIVIMMGYSNILDTNSLQIECIISLLSCGIAIGRKNHISIKDWQIWIIGGITIYAIINCYTYPNYHLFTNILMNIFFTIGIIIYQYEN